MIAFEIGKIPLKIQSFFPISTRDRNEFLSEPSRFPHKLNFLDSLELRHHAARDIRRSRQRRHAAVDRLDFHTDPAVPVHFAVAQAVCQTGYLIPSAPSSKFVKLRGNLYT